MKVNQTIVFLKDEGYVVKSFMEHKKRGVFFLTSAK